MTETPTNSPNSPDSPSECGQKPQTSIGIGPSNPRHQSCVDCCAHRLEINVFFDGTWNSRYNSDWYNEHTSENMSAALNDTSKEHYQKKTLNPFDDDDMTRIRKKLLKDTYREDATSFSRAPTGVDQMARAFTGSQCIIALYVDGSGTVTPKKIRNKSSFLNGSNHSDYDPSIPHYGLAERDFSGDNSIGAALGMGDSGVYGKLQQMFRKIYNTIQQKNVDNKIQLISFNVYGFSRGAATARMFVHRILRYRDDKEIRKEVDKLLSKEDYQVNNPSKPFPSDNDREPAPPMPKLSFTDVLSTINFKVKLVGLFDTVSSIGANHDDDVKDEKQQLVFDETCRPNHVIHIVAAHEFRQKYGVVSIASAVKANCGFEIAIPGCHTDVGDGLDTRWEQDKDTTNEEKKWELKHPSKDTITICQKFNLLSTPGAILTKLKLFLPFWLSRVVLAEEAALLELQRADFDEVINNIVEQGWFSKEKGEIWRDDDILTMDKIKVRRNFENGKDRVSSQSVHYPKLSVKLMMDILTDLGLHHPYNFTKYDIQTFGNDPTLNKIANDLANQVKLKYQAYKQNQEQFYLTGNIINNQPHPTCYVDIQDKALKKILYHDYLHWCSSMTRDIKSLLGAQVSVPRINPNTNQFYRTVYQG